MLRPRVIPCLLLRGSGLVKTVRFKDPLYVGDPVNAIRIFNEKEVDELVLLDIAATPAGRRPDLSIIRAVSEECFMPLAYGGGVRSLDEVGRLLALGVEKVILNTAAAVDPDVVTSAARRFGSQAVVVSVDVRRSWTRRYEVVTEGGKRKVADDPTSYVRRMESAGAGEVLLTAVDRDGTRAGYDIDLVQAVSGAVSIPVVACGGAGSVGDLARVVHEGGASAAAAGSLFVLHGPHRAVLVTYPSAAELDRVFGERS
jgi:cyclase